MAAHVSYPPANSEPFVRGDPASFVVRFRVAGADVDISTWTWRSYTRDKIDGTIISMCSSFTTYAPADLQGLFPGDPSTVPCVLVAAWTVADTAKWVSGNVADIEQLTPSKRTWLIIDAIKVDRDVSYETGSP